MRHYENLSLKNIVEYIDGIGWVTEEWHSIKGYKGRYEVSTFGRVKSLSRRMYNHNGSFISKERILRQNDHYSGYFGVSLSKNDVLKVFLVHILLATALYPNPKRKPQVNHKDTHKKNNRFNNLEWATRSENMQHAHDMGLMPSVKGELHPHATLTNAQVMDIFQSKLSVNETAIKHNISASHVRQIKSGFTWGHLTGKEYVVCKRRSSRVGQQKRGNK
jgi:hypothetical protein